jgi:glucose-1-phosphate thymidylyltransferase
MTKVYYVSQVFLLKSNKMKAIILAGGFATRLWPLTEKRAKPLLLLKNKALVSHIVEGLPKNISVIISTNKAFENDFLEWKKNEFPKRDIEIFIEDSASDKEKLGALGAVSKIIQEKKLKEDLMVLAGDNYFGFSMKDFIKSYKKAPLLAVYDIKEKSRAKSFGVVISSNGKTVDSFEEKPENPSSTLVSTGAYIFPEKNLKDIVGYAKLHNDDLGGIFEYLKQKNEVIYIFSFKDSWFDVGSFQGYLEAHKSLQKKEILCDVNTKVIQSNLSGAISLSGNGLIENSLLENVIVFPNVTLKNCEIRNCIIDENVKISNLDISYKIIRTGTCLES